MIDITEMKAELKGVLNPLTERVRQIDAGIERLEHDLAELRALRRQFTAAIRALDPPPPKPPAPKAETNGTTVSPATLQAVAEYIHNEREGINASEEGVTAATAGAAVKLADRTAGFALAVLHERGVLLLDRVGRGGRKHYKVV